MILDEVMNFKHAYAERIVMDVKMTEVKFILDHVARYLFATQFVDHNRVLDVACGTGYGTSIFQKASAFETFGVDLDSAAVSWAIDHYKDNASIEFFNCDVAKLKDKIDGVFDLIVSFETIEHVTDPIGFLQGLKRYSKKDTIFCISTPFRLTEQTAKNGKPLNPHHLVEWPRKEFSKLLKSHFSKIDWYTQGLRIKKGRYPFSRTLRKAKVRNWYKSHSLEMPESFSDFRVVRFPVEHEEFIEGRIQLAVCRI